VTRTLRTIALILDENKNVFAKSDHVLREKPAFDSNSIL